MQLGAGIYEGDEVTVSSKRPNSGKVKEGSEAINRETGETPLYTHARPPSERIYVAFLPLVLNLKSPSLVYCRAPFQFASAAICSRAAPSKTFTDEIFDLRNKPIYARTSGVGPPPRGAHDHGRQVEIMAWGSCFQATVARRPGNRGGS